jgi:ABC-2 type transport system ATP-binding protein
VTDALIFQGVRKRYGPTLALGDLDLRVPRGSLCGFVGPNGAGKTTTFSLVCGYMDPDAGRIDVLGRGPFDAWALKGKLGVLPQDAELGDQHTPRELLAHHGCLQGLSWREARREAGRVLELVQLGDRSDRRIGTLSHGMRRRVAVASALVGEPELVLLDEPTAGLDPVQARSLREALVRRRPGQTLVVSSHDLHELERICDWVVMIDQGRLLRQGPLAEVAGTVESVLWRLGPGEVPLQALRAALPGHTWRVADDILEQISPDGADLDSSSIEVARVLAAAGVPIRELRRGVGLERRFFADREAVTSASGQT